jgi:uncharacterized protein YwgA
MSEKNISPETEEEIRKKIISVLLGSANKPITSKINFQKELFLVTQSFPKFSSLFNFMPHKYGPYSNSAEFTIENYPEIFDSSKPGVLLTSEGESYYQSVLEQMQPDNRNTLEKIIKNIRTLYDNLNDREFMFLIYKTYGYTEKSDVFEKLMKNRMKLASGLLNKGIITHQRYEELISEENEVTA